MRELDKHVKIKKKQASYTHAINYTEHLPLFYCAAQGVINRTSIEVTKNLATSLLSSGLLVVHDSKIGCQHKVSKQTRWKQRLNPCLDFGEGNIETGRNDTALVNATS